LFLVIFYCDGIFGCYIGASWYRPELILSLSVGTGILGWVQCARRMSGRTSAPRVPPRWPRGELCAVVDMRVVVEHYELWVRTTGSTSIAVVVFMHEERPPGFQTQPGDAQYTPWQVPPDLSIYYTLGFKFVLTL
jgi:hypothetical protein